MENLFDTKISYYNNVTDKVGSEISLRDFLSVTNTRNR